MAMNKSADDFFSEGCGRCALGGTPDCKVHKWADELAALRSLMLSVGLEEECKWGVPCYTHKGKNIALLGAFKEYCSLAFFKGSLLSDPKNILTAPGENSQLSRQFRFTAVKELLKHEDDLRSYLFEAIEVEKAGLKVDTKKNPEFPEELLQKFREDAKFKKAFEALTPGRQRGYLIFFSAAKQSATRTARIEKYKGQIMLGNGMQDR